MDQGHVPVMTSLAIIIHNHNVFLNLKNANYKIIEELHGRGFGSYPLSEACEKSLNCRALLRYSLIPL